MDNRIFNVNGSGKEMLEAALKLVFAQKWGKTTAASWSICPNKGLILYWHDKVKHSSKFITPMSAEEVVSTVWAWLQSVDAKDITMEDWDADCDHDGSNSLGWRVFVEDWGHVNNNHYTICAIKPAYMWHGK